MMTNETLSSFCWSRFSFKNSSLGTLEDLFIASFMHPFCVASFQQMLFHFFCACKK